MKYSLSVINQPGPEPPELKSWPQGVHERRCQGNEFFRILESTVSPVKWYEEHCSIYA